MMQDKIYLLLVVLLLIVVRTLSIDSYTRKASSALNRKAYADADDDGDYTGKDIHDHVDVDSSPQLTYRRNRYPQASSPSNKYRSRSRWSSPYDNSYDTNDLSSYGYGLNNALSNFPGLLPHNGFDTGAYLSSGPSCYSLLDPQYPLFSDVCGAIPQARYSLPNAFGHIERWQIAQILTAILGPLTPTSANPVCNRSLRFLLCPLLFPPCPTRYEALPVLPCQPFCRAVKSQCAAPTLDLLPCDLLPPTSDLCPINPTPYNSLLSSFNRPLPLTGGLSPFPQATLSPLLLPLDVSSSAYPSLFSPSTYSQTLAPFDVSSSVFPTSIAPSPYSSAPIPSSVPSSPLPTSIPPSHYSYAPIPSSVPSSPLPTSIPPSPYSYAPTPSDVPSSALPTSAAPSPYSSMPAPSGIPSPTFSSLLPQPSVPQPAFSSLFSLSNGPPPGFPSLLPPSVLSPSPLNPHFNVESYMADTLTPILVDFPPLHYAKNYRQAARFFPVTRSATEKV